MKLKILRFKKVISTNTTAIRIIKNSNLNYGMVISDLQTRGRGRHGRKWISLKGNLFVSFFYNINNFNLTMSQITERNCMLVKRLISKYYKKKIIYKKPNDLMINRKKICGILQETINKFNNKFLIIGIGLNLKNDPNLSNYATTNLKDLIKKEIKKKKIEIELKNIFEKDLKKLMNNEKTQKLKC